MPANALNEIGIVLYPGVQTACVCGLTDLFGIATKNALIHRPDSRPPLRVTHWQVALNADAAPSCVYDNDTPIGVDRDLWKPFRQGVRANGMC